MASLTWTKFCLVNIGYDHSDMGNEAACKWCKLPNPDIHSTPIKQERVIKHESKYLPSTTSTEVIDLVDTSPPRTVATTATSSNPRRSSLPDTYKGRILAQQARQDHLSRATKAVNLHVSHAGGGYVDAPKSMVSTHKLSHTAQQAREQKRRDGKQLSITAQVVIIESMEKHIYNEGIFQDSETLERTQKGRQNFFFVHTNLSF